MLIEYRPIRWKKLKSNLSKRRCIVDIDETVLLCADELEKFCNEKLCSLPTSSVMDIQAAYGLTSETSSALINDFWNSEVMKNLEPVPCALEVLPRLHSQGWSFVGITACANTPEIVKVREENLKKAFGFDFEKVHCTGMYSLTPTGENVKAKFLSLYEPTIWVEDSFHNAVAGALLGHTAFLINRVHNENDSHGLIRRVTDWHEIEKYINENYA